MLHSKCLQTHYAVLNPRNQIVIFNLAKVLITTAERIGREEGLERGLEQGLEEGLEKGMLAEAREMVMEALDIKFSTVPGDP